VDGEPRQRRNAPRGGKRSSPGSDEQGSGDQEDRGCSVKDKDWRWTGWCSEQKREGKRDEQRRGALLLLTDAGDARWLRGPPVTASLDLDFGAA
jgi:hypothetical protein